jgi:hypothetical protein
MSVMTSGITLGIVQNPFSFLRSHKECATPGHSCSRSCSRLAAALFTLTVETARKPIAMISTPSNWLEKSRFKKAKPEKSTGAPVLKSAMRLAGTKGNNTRD